jgi:hypothetical protein
VRVRMKAGVRPIVLPGCIRVPEHPAYWAVPDNASAAIELLVADGQLEYEPSASRVPRTAAGTFAVVMPPAAPPADFSRKARR